ncbi:MAG: hypothetical protein DWQ18_09180 [Crenarchaeota archaeon]|nr:MAG: hypothetical protein DWQ17_00605 [Thermoproteota archaeon]RDJ33302.1 MAG: hypothetical protein DWQ18_09180 [Thermoproteota archaeon]RDJ36195.1 MAG: hypothetical protein DWQ19_06140 [Thermoproteota archaeon]RDJ38826.1 MAG: hypothetical protein DWQ13_00605 [Thermoproteota archaeon]
MKAIPRLNSIFSRRYSILSIIGILSTFGTGQMLSGGVWDAASHALREPESFWSIQHVAVYAGVSMIAISAILGLILLKKYNLDKFIRRGIQLITVGSILQIISGYGDSISHDIFGIDGLISLSHQPLELGLILTALGGFLIIKHHSSTNIRKLLPISTVILLLSILWLGFNLTLLVGGVVLCIPVYEIFSSGCAIL